MDLPTVIIFHPGSRNLYFGRSSDPEPQSILHIIARKQKSQLPEHTRKDSIVPVSERKLAEKVPHEVESARLQLSLTLQSALLLSAEESKQSLIQKQSSPTKISLTDIPSLVNYNKNAVKTATSDVPLPPLVIPKEFNDKEFIVGNDVLNIPSNEPYNLHCPWRRGQLNLNRGVGGSITSVVSDLEDIWRWCITEKLNISDINSCRAVVVIPAMFDRLHAKEIMNMLLNHLGFQTAFFVQDHVCATFGCGMSCATVVDVGDQKISVSCVEDGVSYPQSRMELKYGSGDLTIALWNQLNLTAFPIPINVYDQWDLEFLNHMKEKYCNLNLKAWKGGPREVKVPWNKPGQIPTEYCVRFGDELYLVPLSYFNPDLLRGSIGRKAVICYGPQPSVSDDPFDKLYLAETASLKKSGFKDVDYEVEEAEAPKANREQTSESLSQQSKRLTFEVPIGIDQTIVQSIDQCNASADSKYRFYSCIVIVGGGFKSAGLIDWLKNRMSSIIAAKQLKDVSSDEEVPRIWTSAKNEGDPSITTWKGAAILSSLTSARELWIDQNEWRKLGSKVLREKSFFHY